MKNSTQSHLGITSLFVTPQCFCAGYRVQKQKGFTLIELLVVVLIIGILAAVALPQYQKAVEKSRAVEAITTLKNIHAAIETFCLANPSFDGNFIGCPDVIDHKCNLLDIDVENALTCDQGNGEYCRSKNFAYDASGGCNDNIDIYASRRKNGDVEEEEAYGMYITGGVGNWQRECAYEASYPYSKTICESYLVQ